MAECLELCEWESLVPRGARVVLKPNLCTAVPEKAPACNTDPALTAEAVDAGGWYALTRNVTAYANISNLFDENYNEVLGYPALGRNFRVGMRFRFGRE